MMKEVDFLESIEMRFEITNNIDEKMVLLEVLSYYYNLINSTSNKGYIMPSIMDKENIRMFKNMDYNNKLEYCKIFYYNGQECKICTECDEIKSIYEFYKHQQCATQRRHMCKRCFRIKYMNYDIEKKIIS